MKILVVEDQRPVRKQMIEILNQLGFADIVEASDGIEGLNAAKADRLDLIISDVEMPNLTGLELLILVRNNDKLMNIPFLMVTSVSVKEVVQKAAEVGVNGYIVKPFSFETVKERLNKIGIETMAPRTAEPPSSTGVDPSSIDVFKWLESLKLGRYREAFETNDIDGETLVKLTNDDLKELGIASIGHRKKMLSEINKLPGV
ncbi:MAG: response regulator [Desulfobacterales bacterium]|nr:response regulator [Desulfobacterales bacterium]